MSETSAMLKVEGLTVRYGTMVTVNNVSFSVEPGQWLMIVGPNGAGKSTERCSFREGISENTGHGNVPEGWECWLKITTWDMILRWKR